MRLLLILTAAISLSGCAGIPKPPEGNLYLHFGQFALCSDMATGLVCDTLPIERTQNFIMLEPETWEALNNYIDELVRMANGSNRDALIEIKSKMVAVNKSFKRQKRR